MMVGQTAPGVNTGYNYYAFISYSRKDEKWAKWLQNKLETYRIPAALRKNNGSIPKKISPIFRDKTDLSGTVLEATLHQELESSQYLIVVCSPNSVASEWVNYEIEHFLATGRHHNVIPFIVDGEPFAEDPARECFPQALRDMPQELLGVNVEELGKTSAFLRVVSTLLNLKYDQVMMRDKRRKMRNSIISAIVAAIVLTVAAWVVWYNTPHQKYYNSYVYVNEMPVGIGELSEQQRRSAHRSYRITKLRGRVIRLECLNAYGFPLDPAVSYATQDYPVMEFQYDDDKTLITVTLKDENNVAVAEKSLTYNQLTNQIAIDFHAPSNATQAQTLAASVLYNTEAEADTKSEITRHYNTYDEAGRLVTSMFQRNNLGAPTCDANGVYGKQYSYDELGQIIRIDNLDQQGNVFNSKYGWASILYTYDAMGNVLKEQYLDSIGQKVRNERSVCGYFYTYDANGNVHTIEAFDEQERPCNTSQYIAKQVTEYTDTGLLSSVKTYDSDGLPCYNINKFHEFRYGYDENGRICEQSFFGVNGEPVYSSEVNCSRVVRELDDEGHLILLQHYDTEGNLIAHKDIGAYQVKYDYDENGYCCGIHYLDADGNPMIGKTGMASELYEVDANGNIEKVSYFDAEGKPCLSNESISSIIYTYDVFGNIIQMRFFDEKGDPCIYYKGYAGCNLVYEEGNLISETYFDTNGEPTMSSSYNYETRWKYDDRGNVVRISFHDLDGNLINTSNQYAMEERTYDDYGNMLSATFYDQAEQYVIRKDKDYYKISWKYDIRGNVIQEHFETFDFITRNFYTALFEWNNYDQMLKEEYYDLEGNLIRSDAIGAIHIAERDAKGNIISRSHLDADGLPYRYDDPAYYNAYEYELDEKGNTVLERWIHKDGEGTPTCLYQIQYQRDAAGNAIRSDFLDGQGNLINSGDGFATQIAAYDSRGKIVDEEYYDQDGNRCLRSFYWKIQRQYDVQGNCVEERRYDLEGNLLKEADGAVAIIRYAYNAQGKNTYIAYLNENEAMYNAGENVTVAMEILYDPMGNEIGRVHYNSQNVAYYTETYYAFANPVYEGGAAEAAGMKTGDILIAYGSWNYFEENNMFHNMQGTISNYRDKEKELIVCRVDETGAYQFVTFTLPAGMIGVNMQTVMGQQEAIANIQAAYNDWLNTQKT